MAQFDKSKPSIPAIFAWSLIRMGEAGGLDRKAILEGLDLPTNALRSVLSRISVDQSEALSRRLIQLNGNKPTLGYHFGLRMGLPTAGVLGAAALTRANVRSAIEFMIRFRRVASGNAQFRFFEEDDAAIVEINLPYEPPPDLYRYTWDWILVGLWRMLVPILGDASCEVELWFNYPEPEYYPAFRTRLPRCRFDMGAFQICLPSKYLNRPLASGDPLTAELLEEQCRKELELIGGTNDIVGRVRRFLNSDHGYPDVESISIELCMSTRTLKRKLQRSGTTFQQLLDEARECEARLLLRTSSLTVEKIAERLGYADAGSFSNAFRRWTGQAPGTQRQRR